MTSGTSGADVSLDERKSARIAAERVTPEHGAQLIRRFSLARDILRNGAARQAGAGADQADTGNPEHAPVFYLDGESHRRKRGAIARFFTPKTVTTRYRAVMERTTEELLRAMRASGGARLDTISLELAVAVAAEIVGLTASDESRMAARVGATLTSGPVSRSGWLSRLVRQIVFRFRVLDFFYRDVRPAIAARRRTRQDDIISHLLDEGYSSKAILVECMTYAVAGMVTTREFIVMAAWHLFEREPLRRRFLAADEADQLTILEEILRLEPVASMLHRRAADDMPGLDAGPIPAGTLLAIDLRAANTDESVVGACPFKLDPDRAARMNMGAGYLSFGYGAHRCPGSQVALHETRVFLDRLLRVPGIKLEREPELGWSEMVMSYELRNAWVACEPLIVV